MGLSAFDERYALIPTLSLNTASGTASVDILPTIMGPFRVDKVLVSSTSVSAHVVALVLRVAGADFRLSSVSVPAGAGFAGAPVVDLVDPAGPLAGGVACPAGALVRIQLEVALAAAELVNVVLLGGLI